MIEAPRHELPAKGRCPDVSRGWHDVPAVSATGSLAGDPERGHAPRVGSPLDNGAGKQCPLVCSGDPCPAAGLGAVLRKTNAAAVTLWIPGYFCYPVLSLVRQLPVRFRFYPVLDDLSPDWDRIDVEPAGPDEAQAFLLVHFFRFPGTYSRQELSASVRGWF